MKSWVLPIAATLVFASLLAACSGSERMREAAGSQTAAQRDYHQSVADYENCLAANPSRERACEGQRRIMEANERD
jgi:hypothetical protein